MVELAWGINAKVRGLSTKLTLKLVRRVSDMLVSTDNFDN